MDGPTLESSLLVAMPQLEDPNFRRTVVQIVHHDEDGTFGLVLNRDAGVSAVDLCETLEIEWAGDPELEVGSGGPVQPNTGWLLFGDGGLGPVPDSHRVAEGIHFAGSLDALRRVGLAPPPQVRLFLGYAGWGAGQLEAELAQGAWLPVPTAPEVVFGAHGEDAWLAVLRRLGIDPATLISTPGVH